MKLILSRKEDNMFRTLLRLSREAVRYRMLYFVAVLSTLALTVVNLAAPKILSAMTGIVETGVSVSGLHRIGIFTVILIVGLVEYTTLASDMMRLARAGLFFVASSQIW